MSQAPVLVIIEVQQVHDAASFSAYQAAVREQVIALGVRVIGRGGTSFEGHPEFCRLLVQQWPSEQAFRDWQASADYTPLLELRRRAASLRIAIVPQTVV